ncbi:MAG: phytanoyl-CoA dioxygenase family protein [Vicinamibacterales bacterium]
MHKTVADRFTEDGFVVVRHLLPPPEVAFYVERLRRLAGVVARWTQPDGVNRNPDFWPIIFNERLLATVREILGPDVRYLPHNDLHVGFSSFSWHRDSVNRTLGDGPDWDETREPYRIARIGVYLQRYEDSRFKLGIVKGSHRPGGRLSERHGRVSRRTGAAANVVSGLTGIDLVRGDADWIATEPGDCVIFDPRCLHTGSRFHGQKYSLFIAYGIQNSHFQHHWQYYLRLRPDLGYTSINKALADRLRTAGLLAPEPPSSLTVDEAWIPSSAYRYAATLFKRTKKADA